jgi:Mg2+ and Co2+ transporter CorA
MALVLVWRREHLMVDTDLNQQFQKMCEQAEYSLRQIEDAVRANRNSINTVVETTETDSEAADEAQGTHAARDDVSGHWQEFRDQWHAHVAKLREEAKKKISELDASQAAHWAEKSDADAREAIQYAVDAIVEAERTVLYALRTRADADAVASNQSDRGRPAGV